MLGIGPGSTLAGRYAVRERRAVGPGWERWAALDTTLDREVVVLAFPSDSPHAAATLDAARRAAAATDPRLTQVLDASGPTAPVAVPPPAGPGGVGPSRSGRSLTEIFYVVESPHVGARSLRSILADGPIPDDEARRIAGEVATALVEAGRIGLHHGSLGLRSVLIDPRGSVVVRGMATEAALRGLDTTGDDVTSADARAIVAILYAALTTRWPLPAVDPAGRPRLLDDDDSGGSRDADDQRDADAPAPRISGVLVPPSELVPGVAPALDAAVEEVLGPRAQPVRPQDVAAMLKPWSAYPLVDLHSDLRRESAIDPLALRVDGKTEGSRSASVLPAQPAQAAEPAQPAQPAEPTPLTERTEPPLATQPPAAAAPPEVVFEDAAISQVLSHEPGRDPDSDLLLPELGAPTRKESRLALGLIGGLILLLALLGIWGVSRMGASVTNVLPHPSSHRPSDSVSPSDGTSAPTTPAAPTNAAVTPVAVTAGTAYEPQNGGSVASRTAVRAYDGKLDTLWVSNAWYQTDKFGGLPIPGLGLVLDVGAPTPIRQVTVTVPVAQDFTVLVGGAPTPEGATTIGSISGQSGAHTFAVPAGTPDARYVIVYVTKLGADGARFRAQVAEVAIAR